MTRDARGERPPTRSAGAGSEFDIEGTGQRTLVALSKVGLALREQAWKDSAPRGLNPTQAQVLKILARRGPGGLRLSAIAEQLGVTAPTASDSVSTLEGKGLVIKGPAPDDGRALAVALTEDGRAAAGELAAWPDLLLEAVDVLDAQEEEVLLKALLKIIRSLQRSGRIAPARMCVTCRYFRPHAHESAEAPHHCAFVDAPFGDGSLRVDCVDHEDADAATASEIWQAFAG